MFRNEYEEFVQQWFPNNSRRYSGVTSKIILNAFAPQPQPFKSLFFQSSLPDNHKAVKACSVLTAPIILGMNAIILPFITVGYAIKSLFDIAILCPTHCLKDLKKLVISLTAIGIVLSAALTSPIINCIDWIGSELSSNTGPAPSTGKANRTTMNPYKESDAIIPASEVQDEIRRQDKDMQSGLKSRSDSRYAGDDKTPDKYLCPITQEIIRQPIRIDSTGHYYEYLAILDWYNLSDKTSPITTNPFEKPIETNIDNSFRQEIAEYVLRTSGAPVTTNHKSCSR